MGWASWTVGISARVYLSIGSCGRGVLVVATALRSAAALSLAAMEGARPRVGRGARMIGMFPSERVSVSRRGGFWVVGGGALPK